MILQTLTLAVLATQGLAAQDLHGAVDDPIAGQTVVQGQSLEMKAAKELMGCYQRGDLDCLHARTARTCVSHEEVMRDEDTLPYAVNTRGEWAIVDSFKNLAKYWEVIDARDVRWYQGEEAGSVAVSYVGQLQAQPEYGGQKVEVYYAMAWKFNGEGQIVEAHQVRDSAYERAALRHPRDAAAEKWLEAMRKGDFSLVRDAVSEECVGVEEGPEALLPYAGKFEGKQCLSDYFEKFGKYFEVRRLEDLTLSYPKTDTGRYVISGRLTRRLAARGVLASFARLFRGGDIAGWFALELQLDDQGLLKGWRGLEDSLSEYVAMRDAGRLGADKKPKTKGKKA